MMEREIWLLQNAPGVSRWINKIKSTKSYGYFEPLALQ